MGELCVHISIQAGMTSSGAAADWICYRDTELAALQPLLVELGITLEDEQVHLGGERYLTAGRKLVLVGRRSKDNLRVIVKASSHPSGVAEIERELRYRRVLEQLNFAYHVFMSPPIILDANRGHLRILVTEFIEQTSTFLARPLQEQFFLVLKAFEGLEGVHATTFGHRHDVQRALGLWTTRSYRDDLADHRQELQRLGGDAMMDSYIVRADKQLEQHRELVDRYASFLTHWDLVPHNFRVRGHDLYLLDHSALRFGCRYDGWARFINFMALYNPELERALVAYVADNRGSDHAQALKTMRLYRLAELIWHYRKTLALAEDNLRILNNSRIAFWAQVFDAVEADGSLAEATLQAYRVERDALRDPTEQRRQGGLH